MNEIEKADELVPASPGDLKLFLKALGEKEYSAKTFLMITRQELHKARVTADLAMHHWFRAGIALMVAKANCKHGEWIEFLDKVGIEKRIAQKHMLLVRRVQDKGMWDSPIFQLGVTKARELLQLDEPELQEIINGEGDFNLDAAARMSTRELRGEVRRLRGKLDTAKKKIERGKGQLSDKQVIIDDLKRKKMKPDSLVKCLLEALAYLGKASAKELPEDEDKALEIDAVTRTMYDRAQACYKKFQVARHVRHTPPSPEEMEKLEEEMGIGKDEDISVDPPPI